MSRVVEMLSASLRIVATSRTVGKAENSSGFWIHNATIRMSTESAIDSARPKSIITAGTGRKNRQRMRTMPTAKAMSLPPRFAAGAVPTAVNDIAALALEEPAHGASAREDVLRTLREDRTERRRGPRAPQRLFALRGLWAGSNRRRHDRAFRLARGEEELAASA